MKSIKLVLSGIACILFGIVIIQMQAFQVNWGTEVISTTSYLFYQLKLYFFPILGMGLTILGCFVKDK